MARNMLKNYGRFELLELIYNMRKENLELKERCAEAEKQVVEIKLQTEKQLDYARRDYENRIEEQLRLLQKLTSVDIDLPDMPTEEEIDQVAEQEAREREEKAAAEKETNEVTE